MHSAVGLSVAGVVMGCRLGLRGFRFAARAKDFSLLKNVQTSSWAHPVYYGVSLREGKFTAEVKNEWSYTVALSVCLHSVLRQHIIFLR